jgi:alpha-L-arabinofuranosidase
MKPPKIVRDLKNVVVPKINFAYQKNISYSQMSMYRKCPHQWATQYKEGHKRYSPSIHLVFGTAMHEAIQHYLDVMYDKSAASADRIDLDEYFNEVYIKEYKKALKTNNNEHFSSSVEMREFYDDGITILNYFKSKRGAYFSKRKTHLIGCEVPILISPNPAFPNTLYMGYLDVVLYNEDTNKFTIIDLKTSTRGWKDKDKKDEEKQYQLLLYKEFFSKQYNIPIQDIDIEFLILKRKLYENLDFAQKRIQSFRPAAGKIKLSRANRAINEFVNECFNTTGEYKERTFDKNPSKWNCGFCPYKEDAELCGAGAFL